MTSLTRLRSYAASVAAWLLLVAAAQPLAAQGTIAGTVTGGESAVALANARVIVVNTLLTATTDEQGKFTLRNVPAGNVAVMVMHVGYQSLRKAATVTDGATTSMDFKLSTAVVQLQEVVTTAIGQQRRVELGNSITTLGDVGKKVEEMKVTSVADLWREDLQGRVVVLSEMRDTLGVMMSSQGVDITKFTADEFYNALDEVEARVTDGYIRNIKGNSYSEDLVSEDALAGIVWSGDITVLNLEAGYEKWKFVLPDSGGTFWNDTFMVPIGSPRKTNAEKLINWYYDPAIAAQVAAWVNYVTPVNGAYEEAIKIDPALAENQLIFPNADTLSQVSIFRSLSDAEENEFQAAFQGVLLG